ncbi:threonine synthase [Massilibacillus massiliensis]
MKYTSTRGCQEAIQSAEAIITGIAGDGGLFVPITLPKIEENFIESLLDLSYQERAQKVLAKFLTDYTEEDLSRCLKNAYNSDSFDVEEIAPTVQLDKDHHILELWHGETSAFKDMALQLLPQLMSTAIKKTEKKEKIAILVATSGDTGKAALEGFKDVEQIQIIVFYPNGGVSKIQRLQMITQQGKNVAVVAVDGNFDDAQTGVKNIFNNKRFHHELLEKGFQLSSANSINWGRLVPQIVYYFSSYTDLLKQQAIQKGDKINFVVPTGNFGNILAGYYAKLMGLPINKLICASNTNNVLTDFLKTGTYDRNRAFYKTNTPSMDILISSNLERLLYHINNGNQDQIKEWMNALNTKGTYSVPKECLKKIQDVFWSAWVSDEQTTKKIQQVYEKYDYVIDTHTAVAWEVADQYKLATGDETQTVIVSTASPYKFNESVVKALDSSNPIYTDEFKMLDALEKLNKIKVPKGLNNLRNATILHHKKCGKEDMLFMVKEFLSNS